jgi:TonB-linked SusC/RagA family outer membrane protein
MMKKLTFLIVGLFFTLCFAAAQTKTIKGIVTDEVGEPIVGASVTVKGTTIGIITDVEGSFSIQIPENVRILTFSFLGYESTDIAVTPDMKVALKMSATVLEEVVVTGMTRTDKRLFTGAADRLSAGDIRLDGVADVSRSLEGRSAGVSVQNVSGAVGPAPKIRIRGATSIYGNSKPLWVVDGVIIEDVTDITGDELSSGDAITLLGNAIAGLNADDIESFDILKDGSATSIYGARAMSGVIVVTTKRGKAGTSSFNYTAELTTRMKPGYREFNIMNSQDQMGIYKELEAKGWLNFSDVLRGAKSGIYGKMYRLIDSYDKTTGLFGLENIPEARNAFLRQAEMRNTDWFDELFSNAMMMNHSISIASGTEKVSSYISMSAMTDPGWHVQSKVNRYTLNANTQYKILDNLLFSVLGAGSYRKQYAPGTLARNYDGVYGSVTRDFDLNPYSYALNTSRTMGADDTFIRNYTGFNIFQELDQNYLDVDIADVKFQGELNWTVTKGLNVSLLGAFKYQSTSQQHHIKDNSNYARAFREMSDATIRDNNPWLYDNPEVVNDLPVTILDVGGFYEKREYKMCNYDFRASLKYNKIFNDIHGFDFYAGAETNVVNRTNDWFKGVGMQYENGEKPFFNYLAFKKYREQNTDYYSLDNTTGKRLAFFANPSYSYAGRYNISGTVRYEGSNRLGESRSARWLPTWNISGAWNVHEEDFFASIRDILSHLKVRTSYSLTAEAGPLWVANSKVIINSYNPWRPGATIGEPGLQIEELENSELTYEKKHEFDMGFDLGFLKNRINLVFDYYKRNMFDLIGNVTTQGIGGVINKMANTADMKSHGIEFALTAKNIKTSDFQWITNLNFSYNKQEITDLKTQEFLLNLVKAEGFPRQGYERSALFSIPFAGLDDQGLPTFKWDGDKIINRENYGDLDFQERDNLDFLKYEGPTEPPITGGFGNLFTYKNLTLNVFLTYVFGNKIRLDPVFSNQYTDMDALPRSFNDRWMVAGDEDKTNVPVIAGARQNRQYSNLRYAYNAYNYSTERVGKGDFIRMKEISLMYEFPASLIQNWKVKRLSVKVQTTNPFLLYADSKLSGQDPEFFQSGGVAVPMSKQFTFTLRAGF